MAKTDKLKMDIAKRRLGNIARRLEQIAGSLSLYETGRDDILSIAKEVTATKDGLGELKVDKAHN